nr:hypothetical protein [uncultured Janthinobacterium sp.]
MAAMILRRHRKMGRRLPFHLRPHKPAGTPLCARTILTANTIFLVYSEEIDMNYQDAEMA